MLAHAPDNLGPVPGLCLCMVVKVTNSTPLAGYPSDANYAAAFKYDVAAQTPNGIIPYKNVIPAVERWPAPQVVQAFPLSQSDEATGKIRNLVYGGMMDGIFYLLMREERWAAPCTWRPDTSGGDGPPPGGSGPPTVTPNPVRIDPIGFVPIGGGA